MNFVAQVEEHLRDLGTEARRKHPGVKEASERAILQLRSLQTTYVSLVRKAASASSSSSQNNQNHPTTAIFKSQEILRPFLLAANYPDVNYSLLNLVFNAILILLQGDAICDEDGVHVVRVLTIQANVCCSSFYSSSSSGIGHKHGGKNGGGSGSMSYLDDYSSSSSSSGGGGTTSTISSIGSTIMSGFGILSGSSGTSTNSNIYSKNHHNDNISSSSSNNTTITNNNNNKLPTSSKLKSSTISNIIGKSSGGYSSSTGKTGRSLKEDEALSIRILQTLTMIIDSRTLKLSEELLCQCLAICFTFISSTSDGGGSSSSSMFNSMGSSSIGGSSDMIGSSLTSHTIHNGKNMISSGSVITGGGIVGSGGGGDKSSNSSVSISAKKVKRAAIATLRQIISIVFDRASTDSTSTSSSTSSTNGATTTNNYNNNKEKSTSIIASRLFLDLCDLAEFGSGIHATKMNIHNLESQLKEKGPFSQALLGGGIGHHRMDPPPRSVCVDLLEMIISQQVELFTRVSESKDGEDDDDANDDQPDFAALLKKRLCPVLSNMLASEFVTGLETTDSNDQMDKSFNTTNTGRRRRQQPDSPKWRMVGDNPASFTLLMTLTKLAATIITVYGTKSALASSLHSECHVLLVSLVKYIKAATEVIRDSHEFEDGFIYSISEKEDIQQSMKSHGYKQEVLPCASSHVLWRAAITLELLYGLISDSFEDLLPLLKNGGGRRSDALLSVLVEAIADFAVVVSSNRIGIVSIVDASSTKAGDNDLSKAGSFDSVNESKVSLREYMFEVIRIHPLVTSKARDIIKSQDEWNDPDSRIKQRQSFPDCDLGAAAWIGFNFVLVAWKSLQQLGQLDEGQSILIEGSFASSLAIIQHFLRRFPAADVVCRYALSGFFSLSKTLLPYCQDGDFRQHLIMTSICKLSLPVDENESQRYELLDHHVATLCLLIRIMRSNGNDMMKDWFTVLGTLESINQMALSSANLSLDGSDAASAVASTFALLGQYTRCLSNDSVIIFLESLIAMSKSTSRVAGFSRRNSIEEPDDQEYESFRDWASSLLQMATGEDEVEENDNLKSTKADNIFVQNFRTHLKKKMTNINSREDLFADIPFSLLLLADVAFENCFRFSILNQLISAYLCHLAATSESMAVRFFVFDVMSFLIKHGLGNAVSSTASCTYRLSGQTNINDCFKVEKNLIPDLENKLSLQSINQADLLAPICDAIISTENREAAEVGLVKLKIILEQGLNVSGAWLKIIEVLKALSGGSKNGSINRSSPEWSLCCTTAFGCLRLIVDDFLDSDDDRTVTTRAALLECCAAFGSSLHDVNISLTASGMLWTIADQDDSPASVDHVLEKLACLASDNRVEVRNCSVNTLFSCIVGCGHRFSTSQWHQCINEIIFEILNAVALHCNPDEGNSASDESAGGDSRYKLSRHHTRDSIMKQWTTTKVLILQGIERVFRIYFQQIIETSMVLGETDPKWFESAWREIIRLSFECSILDGGRETLDIRTAGVDLLCLCCQVSSKVGVIAGDVRVSTNMQVVNGALRSVRPNKSNDNNTPDRSSQEKRNISPAFDMYRETLFEFAFEALLDFDGFLHNNDNMRKTNESFPSSLDNTVLQVLTKLCQGLTSIYDCCKNNELRQNNGDSKEAKFVKLAETITTLSSAPGSKYLTQVQRVGFELLEKMSLNLSLEAYKCLAVDMFCARKNSDDNAFYEEASKILNANSSKVSDEMNVIVLKTVLVEFHKHASNTEAARMMKIKQFILSALHSTQTVCFDGLLWENIFSFIDSLTSLDDSGNFLPSCNDIMEYLDGCYQNLPAGKYENIFEPLGKLCKRAESVLKNDNNHDDLIQNTLQVFQKSFYGICLSQKVQKIQGISNYYLKQNDESRSQRETLMNAELSKIICSTLSSIELAGDVATELFSSLCRLMNSDDSSLRKESSKLMSNVNVSALMKRVNDAEGKLTESELPQIKKNLQHATSRAKTAEKQVDELTQINVQLMKEVEHLRAEKDRLEQQVAVLSEGSAYI